MPPTSLPLASSHRLQYSDTIVPRPSTNISIKSLAASFRRLKWAAPFVEERWLEVSLLVLNRSEEAYERACVEEGRKRLFGLWKAASLPLPEAHNWHCRWGWHSWHNGCCERGMRDSAGLLTPAEEQPCRRFWSAHGRDWCEEAADCEHCEGRRGPPTRVLRCPLPVHFMEDSWPPEGNLSVWLINKEFGEEFALFLILEPDLPPVATTACTHLLHGLQEQGRWRPNLVEEWLTWHLERLNIGRIVVYDLDGSFGRVVDVNKYNDSVIYYPSFVFDMSDALAALVRPEPDGSGLHEVYENSSKKRQHPTFPMYRESGRCAPSFVTADILAQHCLLHHRSSTDWFLHIHSPDLWLVPSRANQDRNISDLIQRLDREGLADVRVHGFDMAPKYFYDPFQLEFQIYPVRRFGPKSLNELERMYCKALPLGARPRSNTYRWCQEQYSSKRVADVILEHNITLLADSSVNPLTWSLCNSELTELFGDRYCVRVPFAKTLELKRSTAEWHFRHWSHLYPVNCDDDLTMQRICNRLVGPNVMQFTPDAFLL